MDAPGSWDDRKAEEILSKHSALLAELHRIGAMQKRSSAVVPASELMTFPSKRVNYFNELLRVEMRARFERQDFGGALGSLRAIYGLAAHVDEVESMSLVMAIVGYGTRYSAGNDLIAQLPQLVATGADLRPWLDVLNSRPFEGDYFSQLFRTNTVFQLAGLDIPVAVGGVNQIADYTAYEDAKAERANDLVALFGHGGERNLGESLASALVSRRKSRERSLERSATQMLDVYEFAESGVWEVMAFSSQESNLQIAVFEFLEKERREGSASFEDCRKNPQTGLPFAFDPLTRKVAINSEALSDGDRVELPRY